MNANWLKTRQTRYSAYAAVYIIVIIAVLSAVNFLANRYNKTLDTTATKQFSLSDQTIKVVKNLNRDVQITYFDETTRFPQARDLLNRYQNLSPRVKLDYIDPVKKPQIAKAAGFRRDVSILVDSGLRKEEAKSLSEEEITGALIRSVKTGERTACFLTGFGEISVDDSSPNSGAAMKQSLERDNFKVRTVPLTPKLAAGAPATIGQAAQGTIEIPKDCSAVIAAGPKMPYPAAVVNAIKTFVDAGGKIMFLLDSPVKIGRDEPSADSPELLAMLAEWGVTVNKDLVLDLSGRGSFLGLGPEVVLVGSYESHVIVRELKGVATAYPLARSLEVKNGDKTSAEKLFSTSEESVAITAVPAGGRVDPGKGKKGPLALGAAGTYRGTQSGRFVVVGTSQWAVASLLGSRTVANRDMFLNMVNWLTADEDLISIRPKEQEDRRLDITGNKMNMLFWLSIVIFPLAVVGSGLAVWWKRR
jgi:ABC-type uncharacterized transport system involved in gliding motility auxiliary subunit